MQAVPDLSGTGAQRISNPLLGLPLVLYGIGILFIFGGIIWADLTRKARSLQSPAPVERTHPIVQKRGVGAIFSSDEDENIQDRAIVRPGWLSKRLVADIVELSLVLVFYTALVQDYSSNLYLRLWVAATFPWGAYFLNYYSVATIGAMGGFLIIWLTERQRLRALRR